MIPELRNEIIRKAIHLLETGQKTSVSGAVYSACPEEDELGNSIFSWWRAYELLDIPFGFRFGELNYHINLSTIKDRVSFLKAQVTC